jgi:hypothetical protein
MNIAPLVLYLVLGVLLLLLLMMFAITWLAVLI